MCQLPEAGDRSTGWHRNAGTSFCDVTYVLTCLDIYRPVKRHGGCHSASHVRIYQPFNRSPASEGSQVQTENIMLNKMVIRTTFICWEWLSSLCLYGGGLCKLALGIVVSASYSHRRNVSISQCVMCINQLYDCMIVLFQIKVHVTPNLTYKILFQFFYCPILFQYITIL